MVLTSLTIVNLMLPSPNIKQVTVFQTAFKQAAEVLQLVNGAPFDSLHCLDCICLPSHFLLPLSSKQFTLETLSRIQGISGKICLKT